MGRCKDVRCERTDFFEKKFQSRDEPIVAKVRLLSSSGVKYEDVRLTCETGEILRGVSSRMPEYCT